MFLIAETLIVLAVFYGVALKVAWQYDVTWHPHIMSAYKLLDPLLLPMICSFLTAVLFLLLASPFFLRSLRSTATRAWTIGAAGLLFAVLLLFA